MCGAGLGSFPWYLSLAIPSGNGSWVHHVVHGVSVRVCHAAAKESRSLLSREIKLAHSGG